MRRQPGLASVILLGLGFTGGSSGYGQALNPPPAPGAGQAGPQKQAQAAGLTREEATIYQLLQANPITAPYRIGVSFRNGKATLSGTVGTAQVHDMAVRSVIALGYPIRDDLKIDTAAANQVAAVTAARGGMNQGTNFSYVYPPPLMGRLDDPFFGFEPPLVTYPAWWSAVNKREPLSATAANLAANGGNIMQGPAMNPMAAGPMGPQGPMGPPIDPGMPSGPLPPDTVEATIDTYGVAVLRGMVNTMEERVGVGQKLAKTPGVTQVVNLLQLAPPNFAAPNDTPPPPPQPAFQKVPAPPAPPPISHAEEAPRVPDRDRAPVAVDGDALTKRVTDAIARRPALRGQPVKVANRDGAITLSGQLPTAYEAMLAYRAAEQVPGVREVNDRLEFTLPDADAPNPLRTKGRPNDVEPYLLAHIRKQVGSLAHVDEVNVRGDVLEVRGTLGHPDDAQRVEAAVRSIPLLRGYRIEPSFVAEQ